MRIEIIGVFPAPKGMHLAVEVGDGDVDEKHWGVGFVRYDSIEPERLRDLLEWLCMVEERTPEDLSEPLF